MFEYITLNTTKSHKTISLLEWVILFCFNKNDEKTKIVKSYPLIKRVYNAITIDREPLTPQLWIQVLLRW